MQMIAYSKMHHQAFINPDIFTHMPFEGISIDRCYLLEGKNLLYVVVIAKDMTCTNYTNLNVQFMPTGKIKAWV